MCSKIKRKVMVIHAKKMFDGIEKKIVKNKFILIDNGQIINITEALPTKHEPMQYIEIPENMTLLPGLINAHEHLQLRPVTDRQTDFLAANDSEIFERMKMNAEKAVKCGVTTLRDCGARNHLDIKFATLLKEGSIVGPNLLVAGKPLTSIDGHLAWMGREVRGEAEILNAVREEIEAGADFIKLVASGGMASVGTDLRTVQFSPEELRAATVATHSLGKKITAHAHSKIAIEAVARAGFDIIEHCSWLGAKGIEYDKDIVDLIAKKGTAVVPTISTCYPKGKVKKKWQSFLGALEYRLQVVQKMIEGGVHIIAGTDDQEFDTLAYEVELLVRAGLSHFEAIQAATKLATELLGIEDETGCIHVGKRADIIAVVGNPLEDIRTLKQVRLVIKNGQVVQCQGAKIKSLS